MKTTPFIILTVFLVLLPGALLRANPVIVDYPTTGVYADNDLTPIGGPWATGDNTISLTDFVTLVGDANSEGSGGVVTFEEDLSSSSQLGTTLEGFNAWFDNSSFYLPVLLVGTQPGVLRVSEAMHGARDPVSGLQYLAAEYTTPQMATITWEFGDVRDSSHNPVENFGLRSVGFTMITRDDTSRVVQGIVHFSDGSSEAVTVDAAASNHPDGHVFFGFVAPSGLYIDRVVMGNDGLYGYDDFGFSTVIKPASSTVTHLEPSALDWYKGRSADAITVDTNVDTVLWTTNADVPAHLINYFPAVTVDEDETFTLTVEFTTGTISSTNSTFRFGVFDSSSTQIASDFNSNHRSSSNCDR